MGRRAPDRRHPDGPPARAGRRASATGASIASVGVDSWGVDYALLDRDGRLVEEPVCYRDSRTAGAMDRGVRARAARRDLRAHGHPVPAVQHALPVVGARARRPAGQARHLLLMPDFCHHHLCGSLVSERTNASTTQLLDARTGRWDDELFARLGLPRDLMPEIVDAGDRHRHAVAASSAAMPGDRPCAVVAPGHPRHGERRRGHAARARLGLHLVRHLVAGRRRARRAAAVGRRPARGPHERGRRRRHRAPADQRHGAVAARVVPARVGGRRPAAADLTRCWRLSAGSRSLQA